MNSGCLSVALSFFYAVFLLQFQQDALTRLGLSPLGASLVVGGTLLGGLIDLPCYCRQLPQTALVPFRGLFGRTSLWIDPWGRPTVQWVAFNVGGFLLPVCLSLMTLIRLDKLGVSWAPVWLIWLAVAALAHSLAEVVEGRGVVMRPLWPALLSAVLSSWWCPQAAPLVAYPCGVLGVLVGADLLILPKILRQGTLMVSIGGAGTFDGIVITGLAAALLAAV